MSISDPLTYEQVLADLDGRGFGIKADLDRISSLVDLLDHPERSVPMVHVTGTNGKTTVVRMVGSILAAHGINAGLYTSPHLQSLRERFQLCGVADDGIATEPISAHDLAQVYSYLRPFVEIVESELSQMTFFELTTAVAFEWMSSTPVDAGVIEVGMGGRWDATNVLEPKVAVLTRIEVDHASFLGTTPLDNATEKVGIIKPGAQVVSAPQHENVWELIERTASEVGAQVRRLGRDFKVSSDVVAIGGRHLSIEGLYGSYADVALPLHGAHQSANFALAVATCEQFLGRGLDHESVRAGAAAVTSPGRLEVVRHAPLVVLDVAHNPSGAWALDLALGESFADRPRTYVLSVFADKDIHGIVDALAPHARRIIATRHRADRQVADPRAIASIVQAKGIDAIVAEPMNEAIELAIGTADEDEMIVITGSVWAVGEARDELVGPVL